MMFKGTAKRTAERLNRDFDKIGARNNAYTSAEMTCFHASVLPEELGAVNDILGDMMRPALRDEDFAMEKGVILEEIAMYEDNPFWVLYERAMEQHYGTNPLAHRVLGTKETITALTGAQMRDYFSRRYSADNTVVALAGRLDFDLVLKQIESMCAGWERTGARRQYAPLKRSDHSFEIQDEKVSRGYALMLAEGPAIADDRRYAASLLAQVLGGHDNSRLHWALIETGLAEEAEAAFEARDGIGDFLLFVSGEPARLEEVWSVAMNQVDALRDSLTQDDLDKIRAKLATGVTLAGERPGGRMQRLGRQWTYLGTYTTLEEELERINRVTVSELQDLLAAFPLRPRTIGTMTPK
jgi:predicted Zn-dependent peptidase